VPDRDTDARLAATLLVFAPLCLLGNEIGRALRYPDIGSAVLFPPYAVLTAALVVSRRRHWVGLILVASLAHFVTHWPQWSLSWVLLADVGNIVRALVAALLIERWLGKTPQLDGVRRLGAFLAAAVLIAPATGATLGAANVVLHGAASSYVTPWIAWFVSNALTGLVMLPVFLAFFAYTSGRWQPHAQARRVAEAALLALAVAASCALIVVGGAGGEDFALPVYASLPVVIWAALRFGAAGASLTLTAVTLATMWSVDRGAGPFSALQPTDNILALQLFVAGTALPVLCLAAVATARAQAAGLHRALLASLEEQVAILDRDGVVLEVNDSWRWVAAVPGAPPFHRPLPGDDYPATCRAAAASGDATATAVLEGVESVLAQGRRRFAVEYDLGAPETLEAYALTVEALERRERGAVITRSNVTVRRLAQQLVEEQRSQLDQLTRVAALGQLTGALAHELHQPLTAILANAEVALRTCRCGPTERQEIESILHDIMADDQRAASVVDHLRGLLRRRDGPFQEVPVAELLSDVLTLARAEMTTRQIEATARVDAALPPVRGDRVQLQQMLLNLIRNGCEAMSTPTTSAAERRLLLAASSDGPGNVHIAVRDRGTGIPAELLDQLFEPFVTTKPDGLGLGLSISRTIVGAHGGRLWAENNDDRGATVHCLLPVAVAAVVEEERAAS